MKPLRLAAALALASFPAAFAFAQEQPYLDDRSDAAALVRSLYNAVNRREYARAWAYFGENKPAKDLQAFTKGYADTERVDVETGSISSEGAAGSIYFSVPVAIRATAMDGSGKVFAGCYTARLANPQIQAADFTPMHIEEGALKPAEGELADILPAQCGDGPPPPEKDALLEQAKRIFAADYGAICDTLRTGAEPGTADPEMNTISFRSSSDAESDPERQARLFRFPCGLYAYNTSEVYYLANGIGPLHQLQFATPELDIRYENDNHDGKVESIGIIGYRAADQLVNSSYNTEMTSIDSHSKWRGVGDASAAGHWIFRDGDFTLVRYEVDASYDGEINPETVLDFDTAP